MTAHLNKLPKGRMVERTGFVIECLDCPKIFFADTRFPIEARGLALEAGWRVAHEIVWTCPDCSPGGR